MNKDQIRDESLNEDVANIDNIEIQPLSDEDLDSVVGGFCSVWCCSSAEIQA
jgi:hypothetical protein